MKTQFFLVALIITLFSLLLSSCEKENNDDDNNNNNNNNGEVLPADNDPVTADISGGIGEITFKSDSSASLVSINRIPFTIGKFLELQTRIANTPQGAVVMMLVAMRIYQQYPVEGMKCLTAASTNPLIVPATTNPGAYEGNVMGNISELTRKLKDYPHLPFVYYQGAAPNNKYTPQAPPYVVSLKVTDLSYATAMDESIRVKLFVNSLAADSPRPVVVRKMGTIYKVTEYSSLYLAPKPITN